TRTVKTYPKTDVYDLESALTSLGIGEAIVTVLSEKGVPTPVAWTRLRAPRSLMAAIGDDAIGAAAKASSLHVKYGDTIRKEPPDELVAATRAADQRPQVPERPGWFRRFLNSRAFQTLLVLLGREVLRNIRGTGRRR
ncbi:MAG: helicase HerA-like domain-containing protein, partial [Mycobacterium sp.]